LVTFKWVEVRKMNPAYLSADYKKQLNYCDELNKLNVYFTENLSL
jgi:hypothetical protein